jgi:hypothetical protein
LYNSGREAWFKDNVLNICHVSSIVVYMRGIEQVTLLYSGGGIFVRIRQEIPLLPGVLVCCRHAWMGRGIHVGQAVVKPQIFRCLRSAVG